MGDAASGITDVAGDISDVTGGISSAFGGLTCCRQRFVAPEGRNRSKQNQNTDIYKQKIKRLPESFETRYFHLFDENPLFDGPMRLAGARTMIRVLFRGKVLFGFKLRSC